MNNNERLTTKDSNGLWCLKLDGPSNAEEAHEMLTVQFKKAVAKLAKYEDINPDPDKLMHILNSFC